MSQNITEITLNGEKITLNGLTTIDSLLSEKGIEKKGVAVAVNGEIIAKADWEEAELRDNDVVLLVTAAQGG